MQKTKNKTKIKKAPKTPLYQRAYFLWPAGIAAFIIVILLAFRLSPWPGALVVRTVFNRGGHKTLQALETHKPVHPVDMLLNQQYRKGDKAALLDVYYPHSVAKDARLPVVVWTHGGAWLSGNKIDARPYYKLLADQGYVVVGLNYSLAPGKTYPSPLYQLNDAYTYLQANAARYHANTGKIVLAGDSAGAQISSQMAALITNPAYAREVGIRPTLAPSQLAGVVLFCGIYKVEKLVEPDRTLPKIVSWGSDVTVWAYTGSRDRTDPVIRQMSAYYHVNKDFPATFISGGNGDTLTKAQSVAFADELQSLGVNVTTLFYPKDHTPSLPHEYQFTLNNDGQQAFTQAVQFLRAKTK
jgi:acetyl esterase